MEDLDSVFAKALAAGAKVVHEVHDMQWGDRVGGIPGIVGAPVAQWPQRPAARPDSKLDQRRRRV